MLQTATFKKYTSYSNHYETQKDRICWKKVKPQLTKSEISEPSSTGVHLRQVTIFSLAAFPVTAILIIVDQITSRAWSDFRENWLIITNHLNRWSRNRDVLCKRPTKVNKFCIDLNQGEKCKLEYFTILGSRAAAHWRKNNCMVEQIGWLSQRRNGWPCGKGSVVMMLLHVKKLQTHQPLTLLFERLLQICLLL